MGLPAILIAAGGRTEPLGAQTLDRAVETTLSLDSSDLLTQQGVLRAAALILDDFATAFAWSKNAQLERDGTIRLRGWSHEVRAMVEQSAQQRGLDIHRDP